MKTQIKNLIFAIITIILPILIINLVLCLAHNILFLKQDTHELQTYNNEEVTQIKMNDNYLIIWSSLLNDLNFNEPNIDVSKNMDIKIKVFRNFLNHESVDVFASIEINTPTNLLNIIEQNNYLSITKKENTYKITIHSSDIPIYYEYNKTDTPKEYRLFYAFNELNLKNEFNKNTIKIIIFTILIVAIITYDTLLIIKQKRIPS